MKKMLIIFVIIFQSCIGYNGMDSSEPIIITECEQSELNGYSQYTGYTNWNPSLCLDRRFTFRDKTGKFNVGDTIKLVK